MVTDFGIAQAIEAGARLTVTGIAVGTPAYMSPEQAVGEREVDGRSDIYSLGILAYQMLTGRVPFTANNSMALLLKHVTERPPSITELRPDTPRALREAIERALMKAPDDRWPTAAALRDALLSDDLPAPAWRTERREPVRYPSPNPDQGKRDRTPRDHASPHTRHRSPVTGTAVADPRSAPAVAGSPAGMLATEADLARLTPAQRDDLRLWHGRVNLLDRIKAARGHALFTALVAGAAFGGFIGAVAEPEIFPLFFGPIVPIVMARKLWRRAKSLRRSGLKLRRVFLMPRAKWVLPRQAGETAERHLEKLAPRDVLDGTYGGAIRSAVEEHAAILDIVANLSKADRALLPDVVPAVDGLVERVAHLAQRLHRLDQSVNPRLIAELEARMTDFERDDSPDGQRRLTLIRRQRDTLADLVKDRDALLRQLDSAGLALGNLRLDLIRLRSSGLQSALDDVSTATQEARALSREIGAVLDAAAEVRSL
jgi:serine/threonine-protein kinase